MLSNERYSHPLIKSLSIFCFTPEGKRLLPGIYDSGTLEIIFQRCSFLRIVASVFKIGVRPPPADFGSQSFVFYSSAQNEHFPNFSTTHNIIQQFKFYSKLFDVLISLYVVFDTLIIAGAS